MVTIGPSSVEDILQLSGASREARAYAFLHAAFRRTEIGNNPVRDAVDCLVPFIAPYLRRIAGQQVTPPGIQTFLRSEFGFDLPLYAIEQILPSLQNHGLVEYKKLAKLFVAKEASIEFDVAKSEIETDFEQIESEINLYAKRLGFDDSPPSGTWGQALLAFLRNRSDARVRKASKVKGVILDANTIETATIAGFIETQHRLNPDYFDKILKIFMGTLVEDFLSTIAEIGTIRADRPVVAFYDTALLLRQMGTSGSFLRQATEELTRYLQDLGFHVQYLSGNEAEVSNILDTLVYHKDRGNELEGETAVAIAAGEVSSTDLRALQHTFPERLATYNIFAAQQAESHAQENAKFQINEVGFSEHLKKAARDSGRNYKHQNSLNDAGYIGTVMRLRKGLRSRDLAECGYIFITSNKFLALQSKRYLIQERQLVSASVPPAIAVGQAATIAWLMKDHKLPPERATKDLLSNCFAAIRPDAEWFGFFREGLERASIDVSTMQPTEANCLLLQAARRISQEESFGSSAIMKQLNMAEVISRATDESNRVLAEREAEATKVVLDVTKQKDAEILAERVRAAEERERLSEEIRQQNEAALRKQQDMELAAQEAVESARREAERATLMRVRNERNEVASRRASMILLVLVKIPLLIAIFGFCAYSVWVQYTGTKDVLTIVGIAGIFALLTFFSAADLLKLQFWVRWTGPLQSWLAKKLGHSGDPEV